MQKLPPGSGIISVHLLHCKEKDWLTAMMTIAHCLKKIEPNEESPFRLR